MPRSMAIITNERLTITFRIRMQCFVTKATGSSRLDRGVVESRFGTNLVVLGPSSRPREIRSLQIRPRKIWALERRLPDEARIRNRRSKHSRLLFILCLLKLYRLPQCGSTTMGFSEGLAFHGRHQRPQLRSHPPDIAICQGLLIIHHSLAKSGQSLKLLSILLEVQISHREGHEFLLFLPL
ncbi:hypothetical protein RND81_12G093700 [Saponaria officinalis]|uniref:Uncharacterized protein n=1 Tax=Saponaria officinalis TaxID=3572 RepID=A0AAW1H8F3_SAPOF